MRRASKMRMAQLSYALRDWMGEADELRPAPDSSQCPRHLPVLEMQDAKVHLRHADGRVICPWVACPWHLFLDVTVHGSIRYNFPEATDVRELPQCCALEMFAQHDGGATLEAIGAAMNVTRERVRQVQTGALRALQGLAQQRVLHEEGGP